MNFHGYLVKSNGDKMTKKIIASKLNAIGAVRIAAPTYKTKGLNGVDFNSKPDCSADNDPYVRYAFDEGWSVKLQTFVHIPVFECGYCE